jgi:hypothetical protein
VLLGTPMWVNIIIDLAHTDLFPFPQWRKGARRMVQDEMIKFISVPTNVPLLLSLSIKRGRVSIINY